MLRKYAKKAQQLLTKNSYRPLNRVELRATAMVDNLDVVRAQHPGFEIMPVLKSNAYGHGLPKVAEILNRTRCRFLVVDGYFEAMQIRDITNHQILVLGYILPENVPLLDTKRCSFVVQDIAGLKAFGSRRVPVKVHIELNTGFNRLGLQPEELSGYLDTLKSYPNLELEGVMTHLVDADNPQDDSFDERQRELFDRFVAEILAAGFHPTIVHMAQTAGSPKIRSKYANSIRLGIGTYGINPLSPQDPMHSQLANLQPVLELKSTIIKVLELKVGETVSYNATFTATKPMRIGVLPLGYYEGVPRELSNVGSVSSQDTPLPIIGRVCMNHTMVDLGQSGLGVGDDVTVINNDPAMPNSVISLQRMHGLFAYTTLTGISSSVHRVIV